MKPLIVTAILQSEFAATDPYSPMLDAVLAWQTLRRQFGDDIYSRTPERDEIVEPDLPLKRVERDGEWWWACSIPHYEEAAQYLRYSHGRFDDGLERHLAEGVGRVGTTAGRYKAVRMPALCRIAAAIHWHMRGEADAILDLLSDVTHLGKRRGAGYGAILEWRCEETAEDHSGNRWVPASGGVGQLWGIRPPYWHIAMKRPCVLADE